MKYLCILVFSLLCFQSLFSQENLVPNADFSEVYDYVECDRNNHYIEPLLENVLPHWSSRRRSANFIQIDMCREELYPNAQDAHSGSNYIVHHNFIEMPSTPNWCCPRSYSQVELKEALSPDKNYYLEYYVNPFRDDRLPSHLGILFKDTLIMDAVRGGPWPDPIVTEPHLEVDTFTGPAGEWLRIHHCFNVDEEWTVMMMGVFRSNDFLKEAFPAYETYAGYQFSYDAFTLIEVEDYMELKVGALRDTICVGDCIELSTNHSILPGLFEWQLPGSDLGSSQDSALVVCYDEAGEYDVGLWVEHCFGEHEELWERAVVVLDYPVIEEEVVVELEVLEGDTLRLEHCLPDEQWPVRWETDALLSCYDCPEPLFFAEESDTVMAILAPDQSCRDSCKFFIKVIPRAVADFQSDRPSLCVGECVTIENNSLHYSQPAHYRLGDEWKEWPSGDSQIEVCPEKAGEYEMQFAVSNHLSSDTVSISLAALPMPEPLPVETSFETEYGEVITLEAGFEALEYHWEVGIPDHLDLDCTDCPRPEVITYQSSGIELTARNEDCEDSMEYYIHVERQEAQIYLPNAFSPNDDGINDRFGALGLYFTPLTLRIYDRYGGLMHEGIGEDHDWDGRAGGEKVNPGTYVFTFEYENVYGERGVISGSVLVVE